MSNWDECIENSPCFGVYIYIYMHIIPYRNNDEFSVVGYVLHGGTLMART